MAVKKNKKKKEVIPGGDSGSTSESLGSSSDATIGSVTASSVGTSGIIKLSSSAKRKKAVDQNKSSHERKETEREKGKAYHHQWSLPLGFSSLEARHHPLMPPQQWWKEFPDQENFRAASDFSGVPFSSCSYRTNCWKHPPHHQNQASRQSPHWTVCSCQ